MSAPIFKDYSKTAADIIRRGGVGVLRTDTLYGIVTSADNQSAVERVFNIKQRTPTKSPIVLISSTAQLLDSYTESTYDFLLTQWPGPVSVILPSSNSFDWLTRGNESVAYRLPDNDNLIEFISQSGPLIAPSANPEGLAPALNIDEAIDYFGDKVDFYIDCGQVDINQPPSRLIRYDVNTGNTERLR